MINKYSLTVGSLALAICHSAFALNTDVLSPADIQGNSAFSPFVKTVSGYGPVVTVEGVVTFSAPGRLNGFFIQGNKNKQGASTGLFVEGSTLVTSIKAGDRVKVTGQVAEVSGETRLLMHEVEVTGQQAGIQAVSMPSNVQLQDLEAWEGMLVKLNGDLELVLNDTGSFDYDTGRTRMELSQEKALVRPTQVFPASSPEAMQLAEANQANRIQLVSDEKNTDRGQIPYFNSEGNPVRVGDKLEELTAVVAVEDGRFVLLPVEQLSSDSFSIGVARTDAPEVSDSGDLRVASFNLKNFFNEAKLFTADNPLGNNRGAKSLEKLEIHEAKLVSTLVAMDADIIGLVEVENDGFGSRSSIQLLLDALNKNLSADQQYAFAQPRGVERIGGDAITSGIFYRPAVVAPEGSMALLQMPSQKVSINAKYTEPRKDFRASRGKASAMPTMTEEIRESTARMRDSVLQTFTHKASGKSLAVVVNHLKSKGSMCQEDFDSYKNADGLVEMNSWGYVTGEADQQNPVNSQGSCNGLRVSAVSVLNEYLTQYEELLPENVLLLGDFNSYGMEDPIRLLTGAAIDAYPVAGAINTFIGDKEVPVETINEGYGFTDLVEMIEGNSEYSYSYAGELGSLDYILGNDAIKQYVIDAGHWSINARESKNLEYQESLSGETTGKAMPYRSSDHDPVVIELDLSGKRKG